jgi:hypothetical protein
MKVTGTFDQTQAAIWPSQADVFAAAVESCLRTLSGVTDLTVQARGQMRGPGGIPNVPKVQVRIPTSGDQAEDRLRGSNVGLASISSAFESCLASELELLSGTSPSALIDVDGGLDSAIENEPPGLIVAPGSPGITIQSVVCQLPKPPKTPSACFDIVAADNIPDAATASMTLSVSPNITPAGDFTVTSYQTVVVGIGGLAGGFVSGALIGDWSLVNGPLTIAQPTPFTYRGTIDTSTLALVTEKDGVPGGTGSQSGVVAVPTYFGAVFTLVASPVNDFASSSMMMSILDFSVPPGAKSKQQTIMDFHASGSADDPDPTAVLTVPVDQTYVFTNTTGAQINAGDKIAELFLSGAGLVATP